MYILETNLKENQPIVLSFTNIYGLGCRKSNKFVKKLGFSKNITIFKLNKIQNKKTKTFLIKNKKSLSSSLKKKEEMSKTKKIEIKYLKELRKLKGYPVNGQRTRTNAKTSKKKLKH